MRRSQSSDGAVFRSMPNPSEIFRRSHTPQRNTCFVLMPFAEALQPVYDLAIQPLVESMGIQCRRADELYTTQGILGDIWTSIQTSDIVIADCTGKNPNVMYELGLCHALWKKTILLAQSKDDVPFDLRQWRIIWYDFDFAGSVRLKDDLNKAIEGVRKEVGVEADLVPMRVGSERHDDTQLARTEWCVGRVEQYSPERPHGKIRGSGESFYFNESYLFAQDPEIHAGDEVVFVPIPPLRPGANRRASRVIRLGSRGTGTMTRLIPGRGYGFCEVVDRRGVPLTVLVLMSPGSSVAVGDAVEFAFGDNDQGPIGRDPRTIRPPEAPAAE